MNFHNLSLRIAGLSQPLSERRDYGTASRYQEKIVPKDLKKLETWQKSSPGQDLLHLIKKLVSLIGKKEQTEIPYLLENLANTATETLLYIKE